MPAPPIPYDPAYPVGPGGLTPGYTGPGAVSLASFGASPGALMNPAAFGGQGSQFAAGTGGILPGTPGSMGLIPPMPQMAMPGISPYGPAIPGTQSFMPAPVGGQWNQLAQQMAGPMFMPPKPGAGIPYPNPVMPGGTPIATVTAPKPPVAPPMPMPVTAPFPVMPNTLNRPASVGGIPISHGGRVLAAGGGAGGIGAGGLGVRSYSTPYTMHGVAQLPNDPIYGVDGSPGSVIPSPFGAGGSGALPILAQHWAAQMA